MAESSSCHPVPLAAEIRVATNRLVRHMRASRGQVELPEHQFATLAYLHKHGPMTPGALAELEGVKPPSMTRTVNALVEMGLAAKVGNDLDKRQVYVELTDAGRFEVTETRRLRDVWLTSRLEELTLEERQILATASELLKRIAGK
ncbi:MarR family transcriptional regulator [Jonesiaceae bacterium BS-20]|uniref:MarR family transcriptional regulator n=1 Tax=Jonesiaceae bacterium BS-20 TaxID=3120821 RepID=A0AAU7DX01_9MICO